MVNVSFRWVQGSPLTLAAAVEKYGRKVLDAVQAAGKLIADEAQSLARANAPWNDQTGAARSGLIGQAEGEAAGLVMIYLYHSVDYGKWLEIAMGMRYQIIMPTLESLYPRVFEIIRSLIG